MSGGGTSGVGVVVVAAGAGTRLGHEGPKALVEVAGRSLLAHALDGLRAAGFPPATVVHPIDHLEDFVRAVGRRSVAGFVVGGETRTRSVRLGVAALPPDVHHVVVHDAARPLVPPEVMRAVLDRVLEADDVVAAAPALAVADTLKRIVDDEVLGTVDRAAMVGVQTPQAFPRDVLEAALAAEAEGTDDLALVESLIARGVVSGRVVVVPGSPWGHKVTTAIDLAVVEALATARVTGRRHQAAPCAR